MNLCLQWCENLNCYQRIFRISSKGTTLDSISASVPERSRDGRAMLSAKELRERKRFRSFTTFSVFVRLKTKGKGILMRPVLYSSLSLGHRRRNVHRKLCTGHGVLSRMHLTPAPCSPLARSVSTKMCAHLARTRVCLSSPLFMADRSGSRELLWPVFLEDKSVTSLSEIKICYHNIILILKLRMCFEIK